MEKVEKGNFYSVKTLSGENYFGRMVTIDNVALAKEDNKDVIDSFDPQLKWMTITDVFVMAPTQTGMIPVEFSKMPTGSNRVVLRVDHISEIAVLDNASQFVKALRNIKSGLILDPKPGAVENSSRNPAMLTKKGK